MKIICHRGFWWPRRDLQNHPASILNAFSSGFGAEIDVWQAHGEGLRVGHDSPDLVFSPPADGPLRDGGGPLVLHLKSRGHERAVCEVLRVRGWLRHAYVFYSPSDDAALEAFAHENPVPTEGPRRLATVDNADSLGVLLNLPDPLAGADGAWLEQPEGDWVDGAAIRDIQEIGKSAWVVSPELHGRKLDLGKLDEWRGAAGICTDYPHLFTRVLDPNDSVVQPKEAWWPA